MMVGCYTIDIYCDHLGHSDIIIYDREVINNFKAIGVKAFEIWDFVQNPARFTAESRTKAIKETELSGWKITRDERCYCPYCAKYLTDEIGL